MIKTENRWTKPELKTIGTLRDVAGNNPGNQGQGQGQANVAS
ncbi:hypothetical protein [Croceicoccus sp. BE223]|nr:hypothetical protein [Croceicoccus sp. BE223]MDR7100879.1 hypothetical protein [Croceicoccus sp. BE223]